MSDAWNAKRKTIRQKIWDAVLRERGREVRRMLERRLP